MDMAAMNGLKMSLHGSIMLIICLLGFLVFFLFFIYRARHHRKIKEFALVEPAAVIEERRQDPRVGLKLPVTMETVNGKMEAETLNVTQSGAFIICKNPLSVKEALSLSINLPKDDSLTMNAQVIWSNKNVPEEKVVNRGMGVRFVQVSSENRRLLDHYFSTSPA